MVSVLIGAVIALVGLSALLGGATVWLAKKALSNGDGWRTQAEQVGEHRLANEKFQRSVESLDKDLAQAQKDRDNEHAARKLVEGQRDRAIASLVSSGDPAGIAASINADLERLSKLSEAGGAAGPAPG